MVTNGLLAGKTLAIVWATENLPDVSPYEVEAEPLVQQNHATFLKTIVRIDRVWTYIQVVTA